ncbi:MAG: ABC-2 family transporter protein [Candidatus Woesearchaeota archaeon]|nr:ABC-2 family transporter protein [Candidatus Woesearchaeota archaeon]
MVAKMLKFIWSYVKINIQSGMEYRWNFMLQVVSMFLNDIIWLVFWYIFFKKFPIINDWGFIDILLMYAVLTVSVGIAGVVFGNYLEIARIIKNGGLDFYLSLPKSELMHLLVSNCRFTALGDLIFGFIIAIGFISPIKWPLFILLCTLATIIVVSFSVILGALSFFIGSSTELSRNGIFGLYATSSYPFSIFQGMTKVILLFIIPAGFVTGVPVALLKTFNWTQLGYMILFTIVLAVLARILFRKGIKRYESGNAIVARV